MQACVVVQCEVRLYAHHRRAVGKQVGLSRSLLPVGRVEAVRRRWPTGTDGNESGTLRATLSATGVSFHYPKSSHSHPDVPSTRSTACRV